MRNDSATSALQWSLDHNRSLQFWLMVAIYAVVMCVMGFYYAGFVFAGVFPVAALAYVSGFTPAVATQGVRFVAVVSGTKELSRRNSAGFFGLLISFAITVYFSFEMPHVAQVLAGENALKLTALSMILQMLNWFSWILELMIVISVNGELKEKRRRQAHEVPFDPYPTGNGAN